MADLNMDRLWAPWRVEYIRHPGPGCFLCDAVRHKDPEAVLVIEQGRSAFSIMNRYPYNNGHVMVAPLRHVGGVELLNDDEIVEINRLQVRLIAALRACLGPQGFNIGVNQGKVAGAGVADHIHYHIVPRWSGDTNFMPILAETKVVSEAIRKTFRLIRSELRRIDNP